MQKLTANNFTIWNRAFVTSGVRINMEIHPTFLFVNINYLIPANSNKIILIRSICLLDRIIFLHSIYIRLLMYLRNKFPIVILGPLKQKMECIKHSLYPQTSCWNTRNVTCEIVFVEASIKLRIYKQIE